MQKVDCYWLKNIPDLTLGKYGAFAVNDVESLLEQQTRFVRQSLAVYELYNLTAHFVVSFNMTKPNGKRLDIAMALRGEETDINAAGHILFSSSFLKDYYIFEKDGGKTDELLKLTFPKRAALIKNVRKLPPPKGPNPFWFVPEWEINEESRLTELEKTMEAIGENSAYRVDLYPGNFADSTREAFKNSMTSIRKMLGYNEDSWTLLTRDRTSEPRSANAEEALRQFEDWIEKIETSPHLHANIYAFSNNMRAAELLLHTAGSEVLAKGKYSVLPLGADKTVNVLDNLDRDLNLAEDNEFPEKLRFWSVSYTFEEISALVKFPALYEGEVIQIPKETTADPEASGILIGEDMNGHDVRFPIAQLNKHAFICGVPGGGKTNTMLHLTSALWKEYGIPFLVLEPAKKEYRTLLNDPEMKDVMLFSPNAGTVLPIAINPFEFPLGLTLSEHISALMQVFSGAFEVYGPVWFYLNRAIELAYYSRGWKAETINDGGLDYPVLSEIVEIYKKELEDSSYDGELKGNLNSFLQVRLGGLMTRELSEIFDVSQSSLQPEDWLKKPAIFELEALESGACNFFILLLCTLIRETLKANPNAETAHKLRHVIFIEEAHNLIAPNTEQQSQEIVNPKVSATAYIVKMLAEVRALNEGIVIADQLPSAIASEVMKNTGLKIVHRMTAEDDRAMVGSTMSATQAQIEHLGTYIPGEALMFYEGLQLPFKGRIAEWIKFGISMNEAERDEYREKMNTPQNNAELYLLMMNCEFSKEVMKDTVNSLCFKLVDVNEKMAKTLSSILAQRSELTDRMAEIEADSEEDYSEALEVLSSELSQTLNLLKQCKTAINSQMYKIDSLKTRFPAFADNVDHLVTESLIKQIELWNNYTYDCVSLEQKLKARGFA